MKKPIIVLLLLILLYLLTGCILPQQEASTLWVITEQSATDSMNYQAQQASAAFEQAHPGVTVRIDIMPTDQQERDIFLKQLRAQIMAGNGPDVYLLPTGNVLMIDSPTKFAIYRTFSPVEIDPLFQDVSQAMHTGVFADISRYYDADDSLNTAALHQDVMNAGVVGTSRYVLPLRYNMPVLLTDPANYAANGLTPELLNDGISDLAEHAMDTENVPMGIGLRLPQDGSLLPTLFDYATGEMRITEKDIADYMRLYQRWYTFAGLPGQQWADAQQDALMALHVESYHNTFSAQELEAQPYNVTTLADYNNVMHYIMNGIHWSISALPLYTDTLPGVMYQSAFSSVFKKELVAQPLRSTTGAVVADVVYYGAVGSSCPDPALAYEYLRLFLTEDYQWDVVRPQSDRSKESQWNLVKEVQNDGMIENSWPVRVSGSPQHLWASIRYQLNYDWSFLPDSRRNFRRFKNGELTVTSEDMPLLSKAIDEVRFPIHQPYEESLQYALTLLNSKDGTPTDVDIDELAQQVYRYLWWYLAEG